MTIINYAVGFLVSLASSAANALGLNLLQKDHLWNESLPPEERVNECMRLGWHLGLYLYIGSQVFGNTIALNFLNTQWVAPLGAISLIFNFIFAYFLVGTKISRSDVIGTAVIMLSVIWIVVFGGMNKGGVDQDNLTLDALKKLFNRTNFIIYFSVLNFVLALLGLFAIYLYWIVRSDERRSRHVLFNKLKIAKLHKGLGIITAICGGILASQTLMLAKSGVKLIVLSFQITNQFTDGLSFFIFAFLVATAVLQIFCINLGLKMAPSVLIVPIFFGTYTALGLCNSIIYLNQMDSYQPWVLFCIALGCLVLMFGVKLISGEKPNNNGTTHYTLKDEEGSVTIKDASSDQQQLGQVQKKIDSPSASSKRQSLDEWLNLEVRNTNTLEGNP